MPAANEIRLRRVEEEIPQGFQIKQKKRRPKAFPFEGKVAEAWQSRAKTDEVEIFKRNALGVSTSTIHYSLFIIHYSLFTIH
ncbi:MAG: hypothetical protein IKI64_01650 [Clostridia bacterium]|nr:hypothetical protein [Clostridia bacterium]